MKNHRLLMLIIILVGLVMLSVTSQNVRAYFSDQSANNQFAVQTLIPTVPPSIEVTATPVSRVLPPIGSNAGLVIGASVLVLIIIGGVLGVQRRQKH